jgi:hypothetical protein
LGYRPFFRVCAVARMAVGQSGYDLTPTEFQIVAPGSGWVVLRGFRWMNPPSAACQASRAWTFGPVLGSPSEARSALEKSDGVRTAVSDRPLPAPDEAGSRGGAQIHMPLPTGTGPFVAGTTGLTADGAVVELGGVDDG